MESDMKIKITQTHAAVAAIALFLVSVLFVGWFCLKAVVIPI